MSRLSARWRLTLVFGLAMAVVLAGTGWLVYHRVADDLSQALDQELRSRAQDLAALVDHGGSLRATQGSLVEPGESFAELLSPAGRVVDSTPPIRMSLLDPPELARARTAPLFANRSSVPGLDEPARLLAVPVERRILVVGATRENRAETLRSLRAAFLIGGPLALVLASFGGYLLAGAALRPIEEGLARERRLVADASHELRTPLSTLKTELELALRQQRTPEELEAAIRSAAFEADRLGRIADDLLLLAQSEQGRLPLRLEPVDVADLLDTVAARFSPATRSIEVDADGAQVVMADRLRLEQALANMVDNALRHGDGAVCVDAVQNGAFELHVLDEGPGFAPAFLGHAFERFSRADEARAGQGTGLGLAIVQTIARMHGGEAGARNRPGGGAEVWISLPLS